MSHLFLARGPGAYSLAYAVPTAGRRIRTYLQVVQHRRDVVPGPDVAVVARRIAQRRDDATGFATLILHQRLVEQLHGLDTECGEEILQISQSFP
jgi:hypothetical protein